jgi:hypothetical protein
VHYESVNQYFHLQVLRRLRDAVRRDLKCGLRETGSSSTIMRLLTQRCRLDNLDKTFYSYPSTVPLFT